MCKTFSSSQRQLILKMFLFIVKYALGPKQRLSDDLELFKLQRFCEQQRKKCDVALHR